MGARFDGNLRKRDLETDTPYNTYMKIGLVLVRRRGENASSGSHSGARPVSAICAAASPAAVV